MTVYNKADDSLLGRINNIEFSQSGEYHIDKNGEMQILLRPDVKDVTFEMKETLYADELMFIYDDRSQLDEMNRYMEMNSYRDSGFDGDSFTVRGTMDDTRGMLLMIPYNKGWTIKVNGTATPYLPVVENFVFVDVPQGDFVMEVSYFPPKLLLGAAVSAAVLCICLAYLVIEKKKLLR